MQGIDMNSPIVYKYASFRFFGKKEYHITRFFGDNVLLLVFDGVLRFSEDGTEQEVCAGEYYIQKKNRYQTGTVPSDAPQYLYVHFDAEWSDACDALACRGSFDAASLFELMKRIDSAAHGDSTYAEKQYLFLKLLLMLREKPPANQMARQLSDYIEKNLVRISSLSDICEVFHYSKNYIIKIFKKEFGVSPIQYVNDVKIKRAMYQILNDEDEVERLYKIVVEQEEY